MRPEDNASQVISYEGSYALVVGINDYTNGWRRLANAVGDAEAVAATLTAVGFEVRLERNLTLKDLEAALREFFIFSGLKQSSALQQNVRLIV